MTMQPVNSKLLSAIGYDAESQTLTVRFAKGATYRYNNVPEQEFDNLMAANSVGSHFLSTIKPTYTGTRVDG